MILAFGMAVIAQAQPSPNGPTGHWMNPAQSVVVEISPCGLQSLCGHVRWASPKAARDAKKKGTDPLEGVALFRDFSPSGGGRWKGRLFVPDLGKTSRAELRMLYDQQLKVTGCAAGRILCKSQIWKRIDPAQIPAAD
jgi:uncharacterized protein (DUF2147 family)